MTILIVDDDRDDQEFLAAAINKILPDARITSLFNGQELIDHLRSSSAASPALIFLDLNMPKMDGQETLYHVKRQHLCSSPVIVLSTSTDKDVQRSLMQMGAAACYSKPGNIALYEQIVKEASLSLTDAH